MKPSIVQFATPNSQAFFSRLCTRHAMQSALTEPTFLAWKNETVRRQIEDYIVTENFKSVPSLGLAFIKELDRLIQASSSEEEVYTKLRDFFEQHDCIKAIFSSDRVSRLNRRVEQVKELLEGREVKSLLDVGCGSGEITNELMENLGISPDNTKGLEVILKEKIKILFRFGIVGFNGHEIPDLGQPFDLVTVFSVLHHAEDPIKLLSEIKKVMAKDKYLIIRDCDASTDELKLFNLIADYLWYKVYTPCEDVPITGNYFSSKEWAQIFHKEGFNVEKTSFPEPGNPYHPFMMLLNRGLTPRRCF